MKRFFFPGKPLNLFSLCALAGLALAGCDSSTPEPSHPSGDGGQAETKKATQYQALGATFPALLYEKWFEVYNKQHPDVEFTYDAQGSGAGVRHFSQGLVAFGASDAAMTDAEIDQVANGVVLLPMTAGSVVLAYNLPGVEELKLSRENLIAIFMGEITAWDDPKLAADNPKLPKSPITVVRREGSSGTTYAFAQHLAAISEAWKEQVGAGKSVQWPVGVGKKGNSGVAEGISGKTGAIGYVEYGYAIKNGMKSALLQNKAGQFVMPTIASEQAALSNIELPANLRAFDPDPAGEDSYPIVTFSWWLCYEKYDDRKEAEAVKKLATWCVGPGQEYAEELGYIPLPEEVRQKVLNKLDEIQ